MVLATFKLEADDGNKDNEESSNAGSLPPSHIKALLQFLDLCAKSVSPGHY
jgi:hypothetical protein